MLHAPKETSHETDTNRYIFSLAFDTDIGILFFHVELKFLIKNL